MNRASVTAALLGLAAVAVALIGYLPASASGQVVFVPGLIATDEMIERPGSSSLDIRRCTVREEGLQVEGSLLSEDKFVTVGVSDGGGRNVGQRVGKAYGAHASLLSNASVGDFVILLPWASRDAVFAIIEADATGNMQYSGTAAECPK